jgi:hypothetical protein
VGSGRLRRLDPFLTTYSDRDYVPLGGAVQLVSGPEVKVVFTNTAAQCSSNTRSYPGRIMVAGMGATPTLARGGLPHAGHRQRHRRLLGRDRHRADAWLVVDHVDVGRQEVEATFLF